MPDRSIWVCPSRYRRLSTASVASLLRQNSEPAIADNALFPRLSCASQVYICRETFGYLLSITVAVSLRDTHLPLRLRRKMDERCLTGNHVGTVGLVTAGG